MPARAAAIVFSLTPPIGSTSPRRLISPVIATSGRTARRFSSEASETNIATPALGRPSGSRPPARAHGCRCCRRASGSMPSSLACAFTRLSAACAHSFMTSPSWPVRMSLPLPGMRADSTNRMSPPTGVHASPVATPGTAVRCATSFSNASRPTPRRHRRRRTVRSPLCLPRSASPRGAAARRSAVPGCAARLAGVLADDARQRRVGKLTCSGSGHSP